MPEALAMVAGADPIESLGGHSSYVRAHARAVIRLGFAPHLFCVSREDGPVETDFGVVHRVRSPWRLRRSHGTMGFRHHLIWLHAPLLAARLERFVLDHRPAGLIHSFGVWGCAAVAAGRRLARRARRVSLVANAYTTLEHEFRAKLRGTATAHGRLRRIRGAVDLLAIKAIVERYERQAYEGSDRVLVNYESMRRLLLSKWGSGLRVYRVGYAAETAFFGHAPPGPAPPPPGPELPPGRAPLVVAVSRQDPRKGVDVLIRALGALRADGVPFRAALIGGGVLLDRHRRLSREVGLGGTTVLPGFVPETAAYLRCADVFVLPSLQEASGSMSLLEALQTGVAVVASDIDGIPEDVTDAESALLVRPGDPEALAITLRRVLTDGTLRQRLARAGHAVFRARFSAEALTTGLREVYAGLGVEAPRSARRQGCT
jgi:glycosyltransferase involved in cell wall biosynthesis